MQGELMANEQMNHFFGQNKEFSGEVGQQEAC